MYTKNLNFLQKKSKPVESSTGDSVGGELWMGTQWDERGGAGLRFDVPVDDLSTVDSRSLRCIVLRTLELLFQEQRWERLVDIALRFSAVTE